LKVLKAHSLTGRIMEDLMLKAFKAGKKNRGAAGIAKVSIKMFEQNRDENLRPLMKDLKDGSYWPFPDYARKIGGEIQREDQGA
jgi:RNA-directed DNA polymerase